MAEPHTTNGTGESRSPAPDEVAFQASYAALTADIARVERAAHSLLFTWEAANRLNDQFGPDHPEHGVGLQAVEFLAAELWSAAEHIQHSVAEVLTFIDAPVPHEMDEEAPEEAEPATV